MWHVGSGHEPAYRTDEGCSPWSSPLKECFPRKNPNIAGEPGCTYLTFVSQSGSSPQIVNLSLLLFTDDESQVLCLACFCMLTPRIDTRCQSPPCVYSITQKHPFLI